MAGKGLYIKDVKDGYKDKQMDAFFECVNREQQSMNDVMLQTFSDFNTVGNVYLNIVRGKIGGKKFIRVYKRPYMECRLSMPDEDDICNTVFISKYFLKQGYNAYVPNAFRTEEIPIYTPNMFENPWTEDEKGFQHTVIHLKNRTSGYLYYGLPDNVATLPEQILEYKAVRYNIDNFENNLNIGGLICFKGSLTDEERKKIGKDIIYQHTGDGKNGRWILIGSEAGMGDGVEVKSFEKQKEGSFIESDTHNSEKMYTGNKWNKLLIGGSENKNIGSGNSAYIRSVFDIANTTVIAPHQEMFLQKVMRPLMRICDEWLGTSWSDYELGIKQMQPISFLGDLDVNRAITVDEAREIMGLPPLGGDKGSAILDATTGKDVYGQN